MGNEGIKHIADALSRQNHVIRLDISTNDMTYESANYLFKSLVYNTSLIDLDISSKDGRYRNRIHSKGIESLKTIII